MAGPRPTLIVLVRHARTPSTGVILPGRRPGLALSAEGRRQAEGAAARLAPLPVAAVYTSPLERARQTAGPIARARGLRPRVEPGLLETDVGRWAGRRLAHLRRRREWRTVLHHPAGFRFPGGESFVEVQARVTAALARLAARHPGRTIVAVSHADPIKLALAHALGVPLDLVQRIVVAPASISAVAYHPEGPRVLAVNAPTDAGGLGILP